MAIFEKNTYNNVGTNGETQFEHVMKKMVPNVTGQQIPSLQAGNQINQSAQYIFQGSYRLPANANSPINHSIEHSVEDFNNLEDSASNIGNMHSEKDLWNAKGQLLIINLILSLDSVTHLALEESQEENST